MTTTKIRNTLAKVVILCCFLGLTLQANAASILIDDFVTTQSITATASSPNAFSSVAAAEALGGERDMELQLTGGFTSLTLSANPFGGELLVHDSGATVTGSSVTVWDGLDNAAAIDYTGLGGVDLATGQDSFLLTGVVADLTGAISLTVYDASDATGGTSSTASISLPGGILAPTDMTLPYASFTTFGSNGAADFSNVGALKLEISNTTSGSLDVIIGSVSAVPEPNSAVLFFAAAGLMIGRIRRRMSVR
ncbi:MAG: PEP-CTERM sorting domain-containing protein [Planctomycetales bacterium]|nr:PEP-CTERM sorting domain-containing protein [Planctomycetales bacterium]